MNKTAEKQPDERAIDQARAQLSSITDMVERLEHARDCTEDDCKRTCDYGGNSEEYHDEEKARQAIEEDALSVEVRASWHSPGDPEGQKPDEFMILLCTGGPAVRIIGGLSEHGEADSVRLEYQDWFTPWETCPITSDQTEILLTFAGCFYFGE